MNRIAVCLIALVLAAPAAAEIYRWTDERGQVHYSDQPPPANIKAMTRIAVPNAAPAGEAAVARPPVVLFSSACGATCDQAADYLRQRGVPFTLKSVDKDRLHAAELRQRTGAFEVPVLFVGESMQRGYAPTAWDKLLEGAGYPAPAKKGDQGEAPIAPTR
jgi:glutaredoxin